MPVQQADGSLTQTFTTVPAQKPLAPKTLAKTIVRKTDMPSKPGVRLISTVKQTGAVKTWTDGKQPIPSNIKQIKPLKYSEYRLFGLLSYEKKKLFYEFY